MPDTSTNLMLPYLAAGQAQKHVTVNETVRRLDALVQLAVISATTSVEPSSPSDGELYILPLGKTGAYWGGMANGALAYYRDGAWEEIAPRAGWLAIVRDDNALAYYSGAGWSQFLAAGLLTFSASDRLLGRASSGAGVAEEIGVAGGLEFTGAGGVQRSALTGDVAASAGSNITVIANDAVSYAKLQNVSATDRILGRISSGAGDVEEIAFTDSAQQLCDDASFQAMCATLGTWRVLAASAVASSHTGSTSETTLATISVPAGAMGPNGVLRITTQWSHTSNANNKTLVVRFGGVSGTQYLANNVSTTATTRDQRTIANRNSASSQVGTNVGTVAQGGWGSNANTAVTSAVNTSAAVDIVIRCMLANAGDSVTLESYIVESLYGA